VTLIFHGAGGQDNYTDELLRNLSKKENGKKSFVSIIDWSDLSSNLLKATSNGQEVGKQSAMKLFSKANNLKKLHVVGISVGAFAANSCVSRVKQLLEENNEPVNSIYVQLTLLDPFTQRGLIGFNYGNKVFGTTADYAQQFLNTDDPVPSTNSPLKYCAVTDVTQVRPPDIFGHDWPLVYYSQSSDIGFLSKSNQLATGTVRTITK